MHAAVRRAPLAVALLAAAFAGTAAVRAREGEASGPVALAWMQGTWRSAHGPHVWEETWSAPEGDGLVGVTRWVKEGHVALYELLAVEDGKEGMHLLMRHFHRGMAPWDAEKDGPMKHRAVKVGKNEAVFEDPEHGWPQRIRYAREGDTLHVTLEGTGEDAAKKQAFRFTRAK
jgi:hypothetical protein